MATINPQTISTRIQASRQYLQDQQQQIDQARKSAEQQRTAALDVPQAGLRSGAGLAGLQQRQFTAGQAARQLQAVGQFGEQFQQQVVKPFEQAVAQSAPELARPEYVSEAFSQVQAELTPKIQDLKSSIGQKEQQIQNIISSTGGAITGSMNREIRDIQRQITVDKVRLGAYEGTLQSDPTTAVQKYYSGETDFAAESKAARLEASYARGAAKAEAIKQIQQQYPGMKFTQAEAKKFMESLPAQQQVEAFAKSATESGLTAGQSLDIARATGLIATPTGAKPEGTVSYSKGQLFYTPNVQEEFVVPTMTGYQKGDILADTGFGGGRTGGRGAGVGETGGAVGSRETLSMAGLKAQFAGRNPIERAINLLGVPGYVAESTYRTIFKPQKYEKVQLQERQVALPSGTLQLLPSGETKLPTITAQAETLNIPTFSGFVAPTLIREGVNLYTLGKVFGVGEKIATKAISSIPSLAKAAPIISTALVSAPFSVPLASAGITGIKDVNEQLKEFDKNYPKISISEGYTQEQVDTYNKQREQYIQQLKQSKKLYGLEIGTAGAITLLPTLSKLSEIVPRSSLGGLSRAEIQRLGELSIPKRYKGEIIGFKVPTTPETERLLLKAKLGFEKEGGLLGSKNADLNRKAFSSTFQELEQKIGESATQLALKKAMSRALSAGAAGGLGAMEARNISLIAGTLRKGEEVLSKKQITKLAEDYVKSQEALGIKVTQSQAEKFVRDTSVSAIEAQSVVPQSFEVPTFPQGPTMPAQYQQVLFGAPKADISTNIQNIYYTTTKGIKKGPLTLEEGFGFRIGSKGTPVDKYFIPKIVQRKGLAEIQVLYPKTSIKTTTTAVPGMPTSPIISKQVFPGRLETVFAKTAKPIVKTELIEGVFPPETPQYLLTKKIRTYQPEFFGKLSQRPSITKLKQEVSRIPSAKYLRKKVSTLPLIEKQKIAEEITYKPSKIFSNKVEVKKGDKTIFEIKEAGIKIPFEQRVLTVSKPEIPITRIPTPKERPSGKGMFIPPKGPKGPGDLITIDMKPKSISQEIKQVQEVEQAPLKLDISARLQKNIFGPTRSPGKVLGQVKADFTTTQAPKMVGGLGLGVSPYTKKGSKYEITQYIVSPQKKEMISVSTPIIIPTIKEITKIGSLTGIEPVSKIEQTQPQLQLPAIAPQIEITQPSQELLQRTIPSQQTATQIQQLQLATTQFRPPFPPRSIPPYPISPKPKIKPPKKSEVGRRFPIKPKKPSLKAQEGFTIRIRKQRKFQAPLALSLPYAEAAALGIKKTLGGAQATFEIVKAKGPAKSLGITATPFERALFRPGKKAGQFIQKEYTRIITPGEKKEISFAGAAARRAGSKNKSNKMWGF